MCSNCGGPLSEKTIACGSTECTPCHNERTCGPEKRIRDELRNVRRMRLPYAERAAANGRIRGIRVPHARIIVRQWIEDGRYDLEDQRRRSDAGLYGAVMPSNAPAPAKFGVAAGGDWDLRCTGVPGMWKGYEKEYGVRPVLMWMTSPHPDARDVEQDIIHELKGMGLIVHGYEWIARSTLPMVRVMINERLGTR